MKGVVLLLTLVLAVATTNLVDANAVDWIKISDEADNLFRLANSTGEAVKKLALDANPSIGAQVKQYIDSGVRRGEPIAAAAAVQIITKTLTNKIAKTHFTNLYNIFVETFKSVVNSIVALPHKTFFEIVVLVNENIHVQAVNSTQEILNLLEESSSLNFDY